MTDQPSPRGHFEGGRRSSSPRRKKIRQKYAPKACVLCRRSKLKCSGENPCQRCTDNGKRCFFSEDQTAAEALQNLSRPAPNHHQATTTHNNHTIPTSQALSQSQGSERRQSNVSTVEGSLEARMSRIENMMEALMRNQGMLIAPMSNIEREGSVGTRSQASSTMPLFDSIHPALTQIEEQPTFALEPSNWMQTAMPADTSSKEAKAHRMLYLEGRLMPLTFPTEQECEQYLHTFFSDIHLRYPCIDEAIFREQSNTLLGDAQSGVAVGQFPLLALHYIIFACCDILLGSPPAESNRAPPGWHWCEMSQSIVAEEDLLERKDALVPIHLLLFQALYCSFADLSRPAYTCIGQASNIVLKHSLHTTSLFDDDLSSVFSCACTFWTVFVYDRLIALSCNLPYHILNINVSQYLPMQVFEKIITSQTARTDQSASVTRQYGSYISQYLGYMILWARFLSNSSIEPNVDQQDRTQIDSGIRSFLESDLERINVPYHTPGYPSTGCPHKVFMAQTRIGLLLQGFRTEISNLSYDHEKVAIFLWLATTAINSLRTFTCAARSFRHQMVTSLASGLLTFCSLLVREAQEPGVLSHEQRESCRQGFQDSVAMLVDLGYGLAYARRVHRDFSQVISVVNEIIAETTDPLLLLTNVVDLFPYRVNVGDMQQDNVASKVHRPVALWYA
ncbi:hypothetical protein ACN47E_009253 [Coniothyrium glycines]